MFMFTRQKNCSRKKVSDSIIFLKRHLLTILFFLQNPFKFILHAKHEFLLCLTTFYSTSFLVDHFRDQPTALLPGEPD